MKNIIGRIIGAVTEARKAIAQYGILPWFTSKASGSIGRNAFTVIFFTCLVRFWLAVPAANPPETLMTAFYTLLGYNLGSKFFNLKTQRDNVVAASKDMQSTQKQATASSPESSEG
jgi:hypothetical protein